MRKNGPQMKEDAASRAAWIASVIVRCLLRVRMGVANG
jgi:hypothetical protein